MQRIRVIRHVEGLEAIRPAWRHLLDRSSHAQPVSTPLWLLAWWREFGERDGRGLRAVTVEDDGDLIGLVPLSLRLAAHRGAIPVRRLELLGTGEVEADEIGSDYVGGLAVAGREAEVAQAVAVAIAGGTLGSWDELRMPGMSGEDALVPALHRGLVACGIAADVAASGQCMFIPLPPTWEGYLAALDGTRRYAVTRTMRELDKWAGPGGWTLRRAVTEADLGEGRAVLVDLHARRWRAAGREGVFASPRFSRFHDEVIPGLHRGEDGASLDLSWLVVQGRPIAAAYSVRYRDRVQFYQSGRRTDVPKAFSPGIAMHALAIRQAIDDGLREYDFLAGASRYKRQLSLAERPIVTLRAVATGLRARAVEAARVVAERAALRLREARRGGEPPTDTPARATD